MSSEYQVIFSPSGRRGTFPSGTNLLQAARSMGVDLDSVCGGRGICARCQVNIVDGRFDKYRITSLTENLSEITEIEVRQTNNGKLNSERRLACQVCINGDVMVDVPYDSQVHKQIVSKAAGNKSIELDPIVKAYYITLPDSTLSNNVSDLTRFRDAMDSQWNMTELKVEFHVLLLLDQVIKKGNDNVTAIIRNGQEVIGIYPGYHDQLYGIAVDIGSTTLALHLVNLVSGEIITTCSDMNPQIRFGEDVMSRISYVMTNPGSEKQITQVLIEAINRLITKAVNRSGINIDDIYEAVFVGNPIMHHFLLGLNPTTLGVAPFQLRCSESLTIRAEQLGISLQTGSRVYVLPCIAGHVGADTAAVILSEGPYHSDTNTLIVDIGTNAEIVLGNKDRLLAASSPTGPAFEGAEISCGQRATIGAIERVRVDPVTFEPRFKIIGVDFWSDAEEFDKEKNNINIAGICGSGVIEAIAEMYLAGIITCDGVIDESKRAINKRIFPDGRTHSYLLYEDRKNIVITQNDIRAIQLAKGALYAGIKLLMDNYGIEQVDKILLAGAFGSLIDPKYAMILGLIPDCELENIEAVGNAAGSGALMALLNTCKRNEIEQVVKWIEKIETAVEPRFQEHFVNAMGIPNKKDTFEKLGKIVEIKKTAVSHRKKRKNSRRVDAKNF